MRASNAHMGPMTEAAGALVLFSGGQDSTVCLAWALDRYARVETVGFDYGQRHAVELRPAQAVRERDRATRSRDWAARLGEDHMLDIRGFGAVGEIGADRRPRHRDDRARACPPPSCPGRNLVFLTYAAALADRRGLKRLVGGMCETDFSGYPDCRRDTLDAMEQALNLGMDAGLSPSRRR